MIRTPLNLSTKFSNMVNNSSQLTAKIAESLRNAFVLFDSKSCQLCDEQIRSSRFFCTACDADLPRSQAKCYVCCLPLVTEYFPCTESKLICGECLSFTPSFSATICPFKYAFPITQIIKQAKYAKKRHWLKALSWVLSQEYLLASQNHTLTKPDLLIPIPMYKTKLKERGYNQAELIAQHLSSNTRIPMAKHALIKTKTTETQAQLTKQERMKNLSGSFSISKKASRQGILVGKHIALVDDVMTTKATCELASKLLLEHGARQVDVWCLARTPKMK